MSSAKATAIRNNAVIQLLEQQIQTLDTQINDCDDAITRLSSSKDCLERHNLVDATAKLKADAAYQAALVACISAKNSSNQIIDNTTCIAARNLVSELDLAINNRLLYIDEIETRMSKTITQKKNYDADLSARKRELAAAIAKLL